MQVLFSQLQSSTLEGVSWQLEPAVSPKGLSPAPLSPRLAQARTRAHLGLLHLRTRRRITLTVRVRMAPGPILGIIAFKAALEL